MPMHLSKRKITSVHRYYIATAMTHDRSISYRILSMRKEQQGLCIAHRIRCSTDCSQGQSPNPNPQVPIPKNLFLVPHIIA